jgi:hypothetical protein
VFVAWLSKSDIAVGTALRSARPEPYQQRSKDLSPVSCMELIDLTE